MRVWLQLMRVLVLVLLFLGSSALANAGPREDWRAIYFSSTVLSNLTLESSVWGDAADPDHDGHNNLFEYATGLNPTHFDASTGITISRSNGSFSLNFTQRTNDSQLFFKVDFSTNLTDWTTPANWTQSNASAADGFQLAAIHGSVTTNAAYFRLRIAGSRPVAVATNISLLEDTPTVIQLAVNDPNAGTNTLQFVITQLPDKGALFDGPTTNLPLLGANSAVADAQGRVYYVPGLHTNGADAFAFKVVRNWVESDPAAVGLSITPVEHAPVATQSVVATDENTPVYFPLGGYDVDGDPFVSTIRLLPTDGKLYQVLNDGATIGPQITTVPAIVSNTNDIVYYVPNPGFFGDPIGDDVNYDLFDGQEFSQTISVSLVVHFVNQPPQVSAVTNVGHINDLVVGITLGVYDPDTPENGYITGLPANGTLYFTSDLTPASKVTLTNNHFTSVNLFYVPNEPPTSPTVTYTFTYYAIDGSYVSPTVTNTIELLQDLPPTLQGCETNAATAPNTPVNITLNGMDPDGDSSALLFTILASPQHGTLATYNLLGQPVAITSYPFSLPSSDPSFGWPVLYTPASGFGAGSAKTDSFSFTVRDESDLYAPGNPTVMITVGP